MLRVVLWTYCGVTGVVLLAGSLLIARDMWRDWLRERRWRSFVSAHPELTEEVIARDAEQARPVEGR